MRLRIIPVFLALAIILSACGNNQETPVVINESIENIAVNFVTELSSGNFEKAFKEYHYTKEVKKGISTAMLKSMWGSLTESNGSFKEVSGFSASKNQGYDVISVETTFEKSKLNINIVFDSSKLIAGINYKPYTEPKKIPENITETPISFGEADWKLSGILTSPKNSSEPGSPIVILVHGSGPSDRDETVGGVKPFRDIAWGLAQKGIRSIRYDKRTYTYGNKMAGQNITVNEETINDVVHATEHLMLSSSIFPGDTYILGHSLGGMLIPRIAPKVANISGFIMMSAPVTPLEDLMVEQIKYICSLDNFTTSQERKTINSYENMRDNVKKLNDTSKVSADKLFGVPASYWLDLKDYDPRTAAKEIKKPLLILQGERDYQVTMKEFDSWKDALKENKNVTFKSYKNLNHYMVYGTEKSSPSEYDKAGEVDVQVIDDITEWILSH
jgi:fermentation-respiration switch protein FrsA (DUF1100 family)